MFECLTGAYIIKYGTPQTGLWTMSSKEIYTHFPSEIICIQTKWNSYFKSFHIIRKSLC